MHYGQRHFDSAELYQPQAVAAGRREEGKSLNAVDLQLRDSGEATLAQLFDEHRERLQRRRYRPHVRVDRPLDSGRRIGRRDLARNGDLLGGDGLEELDRLGKVALGRLHHRDQLVRGQQFADRRQQGAAAQPQNQHPPEALRLTEQRR